MENDLTGKRLVLGSVLFHVHWPIKIQQVPLYFILFFLRSQGGSVVSGVLCSSSLQTAGPALWWNCEHCDTIWSLLAHYSWVWLCRNTLSKLKLKVGNYTYHYCTQWFSSYILSEFGDLFMESRRFVLFLSWTWTRASIFHPPGDSHRGTRVTLGGAVMGAMMKCLSGSVQSCPEASQEFLVPGIFQFWFLWAAQSNHNSRGTQLPPPGRATCQQQGFPKDTVPCPWFCGCSHPPWTRDWDQGPSLDTCPVLPEA